MVAIGILIEMNGDRCEQVLERQDSIEGTYHEDLGAQPHLLPVIFG